MKVVRAAPLVGRAHHVPLEGSRVQRRARPDTSHSRCTATTPRMYVPHELHHAARGTTLENPAALASASAVGAPPAPVVPPEAADAVGGPMIIPTSRGPIPLRPAQHR